MAAARRTTRFGAFQSGVTSIAGSPKMARVTMSAVSGTVRAQPRWSTTAGRTVKAGEDEFNAVSRLLPDLIPARPIGISTASCKALGTTGR